MSSAIKIVAILTAKPGKLDELAALLATMVRASRAEPGNLRYDLWRDQADANRFVLDELYKDQAAIVRTKPQRTFRAIWGRSTRWRSGVRMCSTQQM